MDLRRQPGPHVFVNDLETLTVGPDDHHHLARVLRLRNGDPLTVSDGAGSWRTAEFGDALAATSECQAIAAPPYELTLAIALTKAAKPEFAVQKATELGIDRVIIFHARYSVARWDDAKSAKNVARLAKVAREAAMQSRQVRIPVVEAVADLSAVASEQPVVRADFGGVEPDSAHRCIAIGPEGGWSEEEVSLIPESVDLGGSGLRAETAAVVASAFLARSRSQMSG